jgi:predicted PurR-regulated permease PerM
MALLNLTAYVIIYRTPQSLVFCSMEKFISNNALRQIILLALIFGLGYLLFNQLYFMLPGLLLAITLYILLRGTFCKLVFDKKWKQWQAALVIIFGSLLIICVPVFLLTQMLLPKVQGLLSNPELLKANLMHVLDVVKTQLPSSVQLDEIFKSGGVKLAQKIPGLFNATFSIFTNVLFGYFFLYFMLVNMHDIETSLLKLLPMNNENQKMFRRETGKLVVSNAIGIPILAIAQGIVGYIGYLIFGVPEALLWGVLTALFSFVPIVGTMLAWIPLCIYLYATHHTNQALCLFFYSLILLGSIDNVLRFTVLKKLGEVHPIVTVLGVIVGVNLFGFLGLIFGPLLISYFLLILKVYRVEYGD